MDQFLCIFKMFHHVSQKHYVWNKTNFFTPSKTVLVFLSLPSCIRTVSDVFCTTIKGHVTNYM